MWLVVCGDQDMFAGDLYQGFKVRKKERNSGPVDYFPLEEIPHTSCSIYSENVNPEKTMM